ncbi:hypothetical protein SCAR479_01427 [Seiridium cardinale]|uniref:Uncharacterized protein n=1 Tax=Seiridium cardinale TaxID=138064 RepID=A0ABR2Y5E7_9PEZI
MEWPETKQIGSLAVTAFRSLHHIEVPANGCARDAIWSPAPNRVTAVGGLEFSLWGLAQGPGPWSTFVTCNEPNLRRLYVVVERNLLLGQDETRRDLQSPHCGATVAVSPAQIAEGIWDNSGSLKLNTDLLLVPGIPILLRLLRLLLAF